MQKTKIFRGFRSPTTTPIPDELFDELLADLSGAELKVLLYICRRTFGFKKDSDNISLNQMLRGITKRNGQTLDRGVGLSKPTLLRAIKGLVRKEIILSERRASAKRGYEPTNYRLNIIEFKSSLGKRMTLGEYQNFTKPLVKKSAPQQTVLQETVYKTVRNGHIKNLKPLNQDPEKTKYIAEDIVQQLKDQHSMPFYHLVASRIPESVIRQALSEIKHDGAREPAKAFTWRMNRFAEGAGSRE